MTFDQIPIGGCFKRDCWSENLMSIKISDSVATYFKKGDDDVLDDNIWEVQGHPSQKVLERTDLELVSLPEMWDLSPRAQKVINDLKIQIKKENKMAKKDVNYIGGKYKIALVYYDGALSSQLYNFKVDVDLDIKEDDMVVVESSNGFGLCHVVKILSNTIFNAEEVKKATAWIVDKVDMERHNQKKEATERMSYIKSQLEEKAKSMETIRMYQMLAEIDPTAKELLNEYKQLQFGAGES
jgi:hypothetical protein